MNDVIAIRGHTVLLVAVAMLTSCSRGDEGNSAQTVHPAAATSSALIAASASPAADSADVRRRRYEDEDAASDSSAQLLKAIVSQWIRTGPPEFAGGAGIMVDAEPFKQSFAKCEVTALYADRTINFGDGQFALYWKNVDNGQEDKVYSHEVVPSVRKDFAANFERCLSVAAQETHHSEKDADLIRRGFKWFQAHSG